MVCILAVLFAIAATVNAASTTKSAVLSRVEAKLLDPAFEYLSVLARRQVWRAVNAAREQEVIRFQPRGLDPLLHGLMGSRRDLELNGSLRLVLHHDSPRGDLVAMPDVADLECNKVASPDACCRCPG